jgi:hypothetical protein
MFGKGQLCIKRSIFINNVKTNNFLKIINFKFVQDLKNCHVFYVFFHIKTDKSQPAGNIDQPGGRWLFRVAVD